MISPDILNIPQCTCPPDVLMVSPDVLTHIIQDDFVYYLISDKKAVWKQGKVVSMKEGTVKLSSGFVVIEIKTCTHMLWVTKQFICLS